MGKCRARSGIDEPAFAPGRPRNFRTDNNWICNRHEVVLHAAVPRPKIDLQLSPFIPMSRLALDLSGGVPAHISKHAETSQRIERDVDIT